MKKLFLLLFSLCFFSTFAQNQYDEFWNKLLSNDRVSATSTLKKIKGNNALKHLVINEVLRIENGRFRENKSFMTSFLNQPDYEKYLYALWNKHYVFNTYLETGFNFQNTNNVDLVANSNPSNNTIKDAINYLNGVVKRENSDWDGYYEEMSKIPSINAWQYCGIFENLNKSGLDREYGPETMAVSTKPFNAESNGFVKWYDTNNKTEPYQFFTNHEEYGSGVNYAQTFITASNDETVTLRVGCGSAFKMWLNDALIFENTQDVTTELNAYQVKVTIPKGENRLLLKLAESNYGSYFIINPLNADGSHNTTLKYSATYRDYNKTSIEQINPLPVENEFEAYFKTKLSNDPNDFFYAYCLYSTYLRNSKYEEAKKVLIPFLEKYPKSSLIKRLSITAYSLEKDYTTVKEIKKNIELNDPDYYFPVLLKVIVFDELTRMSLDELEKYLEKLKRVADMEILNESADFIYNARKEDLAKVKKNLANLIKMADGNSRLVLKYAPLYATLFEEDDKTISILEKLNKDKFNYSAVSKLAGYYDRKNQKNDVIKLLSKDIKYLESDNFYLRAIVNKLHKYQRYEESLPYIESALKNFPDSFIFQELKGDALLQVGKKAEAIKFYEESLSHNNNDKSLRKKLKDLKKEKNNLDGLVIDDAYSLISETRGEITSNNYGFNILHDNIAVELYSEGGGNYRSTFVYEITSDAGVETFKEYNLNLSGNYNIIKSEIVKKDKSVVPADKSGSNLVFNGLSIGDVIYLDYENSFSKSGRFYNSYTDRFMLGSFHPTVTSSVKIITPKNHPLNYKMVNGNTQPKVINKGDFTVYDWTIKNNPGLSQGEDYMPSDVDIAEYIHFSTIDSWNEISVWYSDLVRSRMEVNTLVEDTFKSLFPNGYKQLSEDERSKIIYNYIRNNFTYSYVSFRQSGFVPQKPSKTIKTNLGDCKDFSTLYVTLAKKAELDANLVLILTSDYGNNSIVLPSTDFNHCIAKVEIDGKDQFLELTDKYLPYKSLPTSLRGATALEIPLNRDGSKTYDLFKLDNVNRELAVFINNVTLKVEPTAILLDIDSNYKGHINSYYSSVFAEPNAEVVKKELYNDFDGRIEDDFTLESYTNVDRIDNDRIIKYTSNIKIDKKISKIGSTKILQLPVIATPYTGGVVNLENRAYEIDYTQYENVDVYETVYDIFINEGERFTEIPENVSLSFKNHTYTMTFNLVKDNILNVVIKANPGVERIQPEDYKAFKVYVKQVLEAEEAFIGYK